MYSVRPGTASIATLALVTTAASITSCFFLFLFCPSLFQLSAQSRDGHRCLPPPPPLPAHAFAYIAQKVHSAIPLLLVAFRRTLLLTHARALFAICTFLDPVFLPIPPVLKNVFLSRYCIHTPVAFSCLALSSKEQAGRSGAFAAVRPGHRRAHAGDEPLRRCDVLQQPV